MASNNPAKDTFPMDVKVKIEPGTSGSSTSSGLPSTSSQNLPYIKSEPNLPSTTSSTHRLMSLRVPRDLTLGGNVKAEKPKKVYIPNFNVQRNKRSEPIPPKIEHKSLKTNERGRGRGRGRGRDEKGGHKPNVIESSGVWSEGIPVVPTVRKFKSEIDNEDTTSTCSKIDIKNIQNNPNEKEKWDKILKVLEDLSDEEEYVTSLQKQYNKDRPGIHLFVPKNERKKSIDKSPKASDNEKSHTISNLMENKSDSYVLIQLPDKLPGLRFDKEEMKQAKSSDNSTTTNDDANATTDCSCLNSLNDGYVGKLQILKSGKTKLCFGNTSFYVNMTENNHYLQDLISVNLNMESSEDDVVYLGSVNKKLVCYPDLDQMFQNCSV